MNKFKIVNWIKYVYTAYDLDVAQKEVFMFLKRCEAVGLITMLECSELLEYSEGKYKLGKNLDGYEEWLKKQEVKENEQNNA